VDHENSEAGQEVDLFGQPILPIRDRRGRKSFKKDKENQDFVCVRIAAGWSQKRIAEDMGIDEKTLRKHFSRELEFGTTFVDGVMLDVLMRRVREGHSPSIRQLRERLVQANPPPRNRHTVEDGEEDEDDAPTRPMGKKLQEQAAAQDMPDTYGDIFGRLKGRH